MRLLPVGHDHGGGGAARADPEAERLAISIRRSATSAAAAPMHRIRRAIHRAAAA